MAAKRKKTSPDDRVEQLAQRDTTLSWWLEIRGAVQDSAIDRDLERSCASKDRYATREAARAVAAMNNMAGVLNAYECRYCLQWHLTRRGARGTSSP
jgi:hypothetical protein